MTHPFKRQIQLFYSKDNYFKLFVAFAYLLIIWFFTYDLLSDYSKHNIGYHFLFELLFDILIIWLLVYQIRKIYTINRKLTKANNSIEHLQKGMHQWIEQQFQQWKLTKSEHDVAWLIIKGFSFKEIANFRHVNEKTVQQQSSCIYQKSNTKNRHQLMSAFLEDFVNLNL